MIHYLRALTAKLRGLFGDRAMEMDLDDEIEHVAKSLLFEVGSSDPATFALITSPPAGVTLIASYITARRERNVD